MLSIWLGEGGGDSVSSSWAKPRIALSGERSSWLMLERKSDFERLAFSANSLALCNSAFCSWSTRSSRPRSSSIFWRAVLSVPISR